MRSVMDIKSKLCLVSKMRLFLHFSFENKVSQYELCMLRFVNNNEMEDVKSKPILKAAKE